MRFEVRIMRRAQADLAEIRDYVAVDAPESAQGLIADLLERIDSLGDFPLRGARPHDRRLRERGYRFIAYGEYLVFYKVKGHQVRIYRCLHGRRLYEPLLR